mgnify:CR=1 FL=1
MASHVICRTWPSQSRTVLKIQCFHSKKAGIFKTAVGEIVVPLNTLPSGVQKKRWVGFSRLFVSLTHYAHAIGQNESQRSEIGAVFDAFCSVFGRICSFDAILVVVLNFYRLLNIWNLQLN